MRRTRISAIILASALAVAASSVFADESAPLPLPVKKPAAQSSQAAQGTAPLVTTRSETLEIPGLTACHQCEWRPKPNERPAAEQCGVGADGKGFIAEFECGFSPDCERVCNFVRCLPH